MINQVQGRMVIILLKISVVNANEGQRIGQPVDIDKAGGASTAAAAAQPTAQPMYNRTNAPPPPTNSYNKSSTSSSSGNPYGGGGGGGGNPYGQSSPYGNPSSNPNQAAAGNAPIVRAQATTSGAPITPIAQLNMYQNRWTIKARLTSKSDIRTWTNAKGEGSLFSIELLDSSRYRHSCHLLQRSRRQVLSNARSQ